MLNFSFNNRKKNNVPKSKYNLDHFVSQDMNIGEIIPLTTIDVMPGDKITLNTQVLARLAPLVAPINTNLKMDIRVFYAPHRLFYRDFNEMMMGGTTDALSMPQITIGSAADYQTFYKSYGRLYVNFGLPQDSSIYGTVPTSWLDKLPLWPLRFYNSVYYHYYMDSRKFSETELRDFRGKMVRNDFVSVTPTSLLTGEGSYCRDYWQNGTLGTSITRGYYEAMHRGDYQSQIFPTVNKVNAVIGTTVPELKAGQNMQKYLMNLLEAKRNFIKYSLATFGAAESDEITQPLYIGGSQSYINVSDVTATTQASNQPLGAYAGRAFARDSSFIDFDVPAYGAIMVCATVIPDIKYHNNLHPRMKQFDALDYPRPEFATSYYEDVKLKDLMWDSTQTNGTLDAVVGYAVPYNSYRYGFNNVRGRLAEDLSYWNVIHKFPSSPVNLSVGRMHLFTDTGTGKDNRWHTMTKGLFSVIAEPQIYCDFEFRCDALRVLPYVDQNLMP